MRLITSATIKQNLLLLALQLRRVDAELGKIRLEQEQVKQAELEKERRILIDEEKYWQAKMVSLEQEQVKQAELEKTRLEKKQVKQAESEKERRILIDKEKYWRASLVNLEQEYAKDTGVEKIMLSFFLKRFSSRKNFIQKKMKDTLARERLIMAEA